MSSVEEIHTDIYVFKHSKCSNTLSVVHVQKQIKFTMTQKVYFHAPKCTLTPISFRIRNGVNFNDPQIMLEVPFTFCLMKYEGLTGIF